MGFQRNYPSSSPKNEIHQDTSIHQTSTEYITTVQLLDSYEPGVQKNSALSPFIAVFLPSYPKAIMTIQDSIPKLNNEEDFHACWKGMKNVIGQHDAVAFLKPESPAYAGWTTGIARTEYCGQKPPKEFPEPMPEEPGPRQESSAVHNTRSTSNSLHNILFLRYRG